MHVSKSNWIMACFWGQNRGHYLGWKNPFNSWLNHFRVLGEVTRSWMQFYCNLKYNSRALFFATNPSVVELCGTNARICKEGDGRLLWRGKHGYSEKTTFPKHHILLWDATVVSISNNAGISLKCVNLQNMPIFPHELYEISCVFIYLLISQTVPSSMVSYTK